MQPVKPLMSTKSEPPLTMIDPHQEGIRNVDQVTFHRTVGSHLDITCCALLPISPNGTDWTTTALITARLRMDVTMAKALADGLTKQIAMIDAAHGTMN